MIGQKLKYYRLRKNLSLKELSEKTNLTTMALSNYELDKRKPSLDILKKLSIILEFNITDLIDNQSSTLNITFGKFRKETRLSNSTEELIKESIKDYLSRFFQALSFVNDYSLINMSSINKIIKFENDIEKIALEIREYLALSISGPINSIANILENKGILIFFIDIDSRYFSGLNGIVNNKPYIVVNSHMPTSRIRSTIIHELIHIICDFPEELSDKDEEKIIESITGAFLFPKNDVIRELGIRRKIISKDMSMVCKEYGISMFMLAKRARICNVINENVEKEFYITASRLGWKTNEPNWNINEEKTYLLEQLVFRSVTENTITVQKGAELLRIPFTEVAKACYF